MKYLIAVIVASVALFAVQEAYQADAYSPDAPNLRVCSAALKSPRMDYNGSIRKACGLEEDQFADVYETLRGLTPPANGALSFDFASQWLSRNGMNPERCQVEFPYGIVFFGSVTEGRRFMRAYGIDPYNTPYGFDIVC